ncbi:hypothetical protein C2S52_006488 [Perilla frutescens var. hirtella]|nr:hypothetical protein C2S51_009310 [Perilla frutescens var. frutescens]KAH6786936.1 hypothetical protein C2S52_006488 [Perilla frutescens var. hirtella]
MSLDREWMYRRYLHNGALNPDFLNGLNSFIEFSYNQPSFMSVDKIKCLCRKCKNIPFQTPSTVKLHVAKKGFVHNSTGASGHRVEFGWSGWNEYIPEHGNGCCWTAYQHECQ